MVKSELLKLKDEDGDPLLDEDEIDGGGLRVTTTFTKKAMDAAEKGVLTARPEGFSDKELHIGVASVDVPTGAVKGIYAGQDYLQSQINWAQAGGLAGSSMKPFAMAAGIKAGFSLKDTFDGNSPYLLDDGTEIENEGDHDYGAAVNMITALEDSINTAFTDLTVSIPDGPQKVMEMMNAMGIPPEKAPRKNAYGFPDHTPGLQPFPGITLGSATVSPINMANAYATIANGGRFHAPYIIEKVVNRDGETLYDHSVSDEQVIDQDQGSDIAADVSYAMQQVVESGTGTAALGLGRPAAGKTGTATNDPGDVISAWFSGFTPQMSTSVMYVRGKGNGKLDGWLPSYFGGDFPAETWTEVMKLDMEGVDEEAFPEPAYVDGEAPTEGHQPTLPPKPTKTPSPTETPSNTDKPTKTPTVVPTPTPPTVAPTTEVPTTAPPPPPTETPTSTCDVLGCPTTPTDTATPTPPRAAATATRASSIWAWWSRMRW
jgi:membrane peptidoglycan carboxypeptidase